MINSLFSAFIRDIILRKKDFKSAASYLSKASADTIRKDLDNLELDFRRKRKNALIEAFFKFLTRDASECLDTMSETGEFGKFTKSPLGITLKTIFKKNTADSFTRKASRFLEGYGKSIVYIQTATELNAKTKAKVRSSLADTYVIFKIENNLLGGIRVVKKGTIYDATWNSVLTTILNTSYAK
jgi:hypothetical protein